MRVLDLFCGAGGASMGLYQAWPDAEIIGVDIKPQPRYPFQFVRANAMEYPLEGFDFIWASPPCQYYVCKRQGWDTGKHLPLIDPIRLRLLQTGIPFVIENVRRAPIRVNLMLCGTMFDLKVFRHRYFEIEGFKIETKQHYKHVGSVHTGEYCTVYNGGDGVGGYGTNIVKRRAARAKMKAAGITQSTERWKEAMGIDWMERQELTESIPPAYSRYIAQQFDRTRQ